MLAMDRWLGERRRMVLFVIVLVSALLRVGYYAQLVDSPHLSQQQGPNFDMGFFSDWAERITAGDWLSEDESDPERPLHPLHAWHLSIALIHFDEPPVPSVDEVDPQRLEAYRKLWNGWYGPKRFHQEPLYPYLIALTYAVFGPDMRHVYVWQLLAGICVNVLVYLLARRCFGDLIGTLSGFLAVFCAPLLLFDMVLLRVTLITLAGLLLVYLTELALEKKSWIWYLGAGLALAPAVLLKTTLVLLGICMFVRLARGGDGTLRAGLRRTAPFLAGALLGLAPAMLRNAIVGEPLMSFSSVAAVTFICSNSPSYSADTGFSPPYEDIARIMAETNGSFLPTVLATLSSHSLWSYLAQLWGKFGATWYWFEVPNNVNYYNVRAMSSVLGALPVTFFWLAPLSMLGLCLGLRRWRPAGMLYGLVLASILPLLAFYVLSRFRVPLTTALIPFAALAVVRTVDWLLAGRYGNAGAAAAGILLLSLWTMRPMAGDLVPLQPVAYMLAWKDFYKPEEEKARWAGDYARAASVMRRALATEPELVRKLGRNNRIQNPFEANLVTMFGLFHQRYGEDLTGVGQDREARLHMNRARELQELLEDFKSRTMDK